MATGRVPTTANSPLTAKGDLFTYSTAPARLAVGSDGDSLVADSAAATGLRYQPIQTRNIVYNSGLNIWQRGTSFTASGYCADRWYFDFGAGTGRTISRQTGTDQFQYVQRIQRNSSNTSTTVMYAGQSFEIADSTPFAGKTVTVSFYARKGADFSGASSALPITVFSGTSSTEANRITTAYASGGATAGSTTATLTTSLQRFQFTFTFGSTVTQFAIVMDVNWAGTAGTNDYIDFTGFQLEVGSIATNYVRQTGSIQGELAACQRYYYRTEGSSGNSVYGTGTAANSTAAYMFVPFQAKMRTAPTVLDYSILAVSDGSTWTAVTSATLTFNSAGNGGAITANVASGLAQFRPYLLTANGNSAGYIGFGAEL
jgi:hypothetical protein